MTGQQEEEAVFSDICAIVDLVINRPRPSGAEATSDSQSMPAVLVGQIWGWGGWGGGGI